MRSGFHNDRGALDACVAFLLLAISLAACRLIDPTYGLLTALAEQAAKQAKEAREQAEHRKRLEGPPPKRSKACPPCSSEERCVQFFDRDCKTSGPVCRKVSVPCRDGGCRSCESEICGETQSCMEESCGGEAEDAFPCYAPRDARIWK